MLEIALGKYAKPSSDGKKRLDWATIQNFLISDNYRKISNTKTKHSLLFSLDNLDYINPDGLVWILLIGKKLRFDGNSLWLRLPRNKDQLLYLKKSEFDQIGKEIFIFSNPYFLDDIKCRKLPDFYCFQIVSISRLRNLIDSLGEYMGIEGGGEFFRLLDLTPTGEEAFEYIPIFLKMLIETSKNIVEHSNLDSEQPMGFFVIKKVRPDLLRICIGDTGCGLASSLSAKDVSVKNDFDAIRHALLFRFFNPKSKKEGLFRVVQFVSRWHGFIRIHSATISAFLNLEEKKLEDDYETKVIIEEKLKKLNRYFVFPGVQYLIDLKVPKRYFKVKAHDRY